MQNDIRLFNIDDYKNGDKIVSNSDFSPKEIDIFLQRNWDVWFCTLTNGHNLHPIRIKFGIMKVLE